MWIGIGSGVLSIVLLVIGFVVLEVEHSIQSSRPAATDTMPGTVRFDAEDRRYSVLLRGGNDDSNRARCDITRSDGTRAKIRGDIQVIALESGAGETVGEFQAKDGPTVVACRWAERDARRLELVVAPQEEKLRFVAIALIIAGGVLLLAALLLLALGAKDWATRTGGY